MEPQQPHNHARNSQLPHLQSVLPPHIPSRTANSTPITSPGLFSPGNPRANMSLPPQPVSEGTTPAPTHSPYLHPLQTHRVRETHIANVDRDFTTGRKIINHYEIIDEIGRGVHGKVKLARNLENGENVAIKIIPRFSKKRRLGKVTANMNPQEKTKREIAILKKIRHPNVVALLEVIDDPELKKIYMVLEHVERGEIVWRKKGLPHICAYERRRAEREMRGESLTAQEEDYGRILERRHTIKEMKRAKTTHTQTGHHDYWSLEYAAEDDDVDMQSRISSLSNIEYAERAMPSNPPSMQGSRPSSRAPSRTHSVRSLQRTTTASYSTEPDLTPLPLDEEDLDTPGPLRSNPGSSSALDGTMYGAYDDAGFRGRSPSMADSIISHMSSIDLSTQVNDSFAEDFSFVPCFTMEHARATFRDTVLGLEYLHYEGVVHRDIKPANLLWTRDHRVKISDFGVSYFGRPIRDGEIDDTVSESEARDFDDDLELAKTVGTPAFFAPELCYTDLDSEQPRVSEQIDVWSLGVTLYCLIFARIPFMAEDEFQMFRKIAKDEVYIPSRRLRPVDPSTSPKTTSLYNRVNIPPYRDDDELGYEEVDDVLRDLLKRMLIKNPEKRIRLREVKRHPWVVQDIGNVVGWLDDSDPSRRTAGRKIQVDDKEMREAVIPLSLLERARSAVKKTFNKFTHPRSTDRGESTSRRRAASSAASSAGDSPATNPSTPYPRDIRRRSLRGDTDYFATVREYIQPSGEHPLSQSVAASPQDSPLDQGPSSTTASVGGFSDMMAKEEAAERQTPTASQKLAKQHHYARSITNAFLSLAPHVHEAHSHTMPSTPAFDGPADDSSFLRKGRDINSSPEDASRARSADRAIIFSNVDKRAEAKVSLSTAVAPGSVALSKRAQQIRPGETSLPSPSFFSARAINAYQHGQPKSDPNMHDKQRTIVELDERPMTAQRIGDVPDGKTPAPRVYNTSTPESFAKAQETNRRRQLLDYEDKLRRQHAPKVSIGGLDPASIPCPPSPDDELFMQRHSAPSREEIVGTAVSSSSVSVDALTTPLTSPSVVTSPLYVANPIPTKDISEQISEQILAFQSDPSLPALLSGASSVSADLEGEFLGHPGNPDAVKNAALLETTDSLTPPAMTKEPLAGFPLEQQELSAEGNIIPVYIDRHTVKYTTSASPSASARAVEDEEDSDSDEGLVMAKSKKKTIGSKDAQAPMGKMVIGSKRRDTNASVGSTETAKKIVVHSD